MKSTFIDKSTVYFGYIKNKRKNKENENEIKEPEYYISDAREEEDMKDCFILFIKHLNDVCFINIEYKVVLSDLSTYSNNNIHYLL